MTARTTYLILFCLSILTTCSFRTYAQEPRKVAIGFKQYLGVYTRSFPQQQIVLHNVRIRQIGPHTFLSGTPVAVMDNSTRLTPRQGVLWTVALSEVTEFYEFDDIQGYRHDGKEPRFLGR